MTKLLLAITIAIGMTYAQGFFTIARTEDIIKFFITVIGSAVIMMLFLWDEEC